jgi:uncharacterized protein YjbI with pentapeptide repeats
VFSGVSLTSYLGLCRTENDVMANGQHLDILRKQAASLAKWKEENSGRLFWNTIYSMSKEESDPIVKEVFPWNGWRCEHPEIQPDLSGATLVDADLSYANLSGVDFSKARLVGANLEDAYCMDTNFAEAELGNAKFGRGSFRRANFRRAAFGERLLEGNTFGGAHLAKMDFVEADFSEAYLFAADFYGADLRRAVLRGTTLTGTNFSTADLSGADLSDASMSAANFMWADLRGARLCGAGLFGCNLVEAKLQHADLSNAFVYGVSAWNVELEGANQSNLVIMRDGNSVVTVDNLEVAQFIYLLLNNKKIRDVIDTIGKKAVLILGRFTPERKEILDALREALRVRGYLPILFDFDAPTSRDITETVSTLAHLSRFVIADITDAKSIPQELQAIVPNLPSVPVQPLLLAPQHEYGMFEHFKRYPWVLETYLYNNKDELLTSLSTTIIEPAEAKANELRPHTTEQ